jgi:hypothetical protein
MRPRFVGTAAILEHSFSLLATNAAIIPFFPAPIGSSRFDDISLIFSHYVTQVLPVFFFLDCP